MQTLASSLGELRLVSAFKKPQEKVVGTYGEKRNYFFFSGEREKPP